MLSGANINFDRLRFVAERAELGESREALFGRVLAGFEVPPAGMADFQGFLERLGYHYERKAENAAYEMFLA